MLDRIALIVLLVVSSFLSTLYLGEMLPPQVGEPLSTEQIKAQSKFFHKDQMGVHQVVLTGSDFERGQQFGFWTKDFLIEQEESLKRKIQQIFPSTLFRHALFLFSMIWFHDLEDYIEDSWKEEMYGVTIHTPLDRLYFSTIYTRQLAYHGIHDMGQMMIDSGLVLGACTQVLVPNNEGWVIGRNFDFEAGPVFDEDKVMKWVFPDDGVPYVSVLFSGMVGVITGVNAYGVYIALNAAGSDDFVRVGTPTNLIVYKALRTAQNALEAVEIIKNSNSLITDIFVVSDPGHQAYVVEKSPEKVAVREIVSPSVVTNHFEDPLWDSDKNNQKRKRQTTSLERQARGQELLLSFNNQVDTQSMLSILRDKKTPQGQFVPGHRSSIDALIASHSIIYDSSQMKLYVSSGGSLTKAFYGFDLKQSFINRTPVAVDKFEADPEVSPEDRLVIKESLNNLQTAKVLAMNKECSQAEELFFSVPKELLSQHYLLAWTQAEIFNCKMQHKEALAQWQKALSQEPAYLREKNEIKGRIENAR